MKTSEMANEELAKELMSRVPLDSNRHDDIREAAARLIRIEDVRELKPIDGSSWYRPPTRSTLMSMTKAELVEWVAIGFVNWHKSDEQIANMREYWKCKDEEIKLT